jgi:hypothetical protein
VVVEHVNAPVAAGAVMDSWDFESATGWHTAYPWFILNPISLSWHFNLIGYFWMFEMMWLNKAWITVHCLLVTKEHRDLKVENQQEHQVVLV